MFGHFRFGFAGFLLVSGFATPAASNPLTDLFSSNAAPVAAAAASAPAQEECLLEPGKSSAPGQHWVYRHDGHRKCWFQAEAGTASAGKPIHRNTVRRGAAKEENESAPRKQEEAVVDARAEMLRSAPAEAAQPLSHAPMIKLVDTTPVSATDAAAVAPSPPLLGNAASDQVTPEHSAPPRLNEEALLVAAAQPVPHAVDAAPPVAVRIPEANDDGRWFMASWFGVLLMALGGAALLGASRTRRRVAHVGRFR